ncbi:MAG: aspartate aminotransferase family protein [Hyphomicrobiales bacterium]|nr:aspartate aminotransferase family protein [Hyphomicrobiales bacterium]
MSAVLPTYARTDLVFEQGEGVYLTTTSGETFLDFGAGIAVTALGHAHPALVAALTEQAGKLWHTSNLYRVAGQERLAEKLIAATFADKAFFANSGAEAVECAIKMARKYHSHNGAPERYRLITFDNAFHGRTLATIAAGGQPKLLDGFGPAVDGFDTLPLGDLEAVEGAIGEETAGILIEPLLGEGGVQAVPWQFLRDLRALCDVNGILLLLDEIQTGMGRTGKLFAHEWADMAPDIMAVAKGLGGGFPVGACLATDAAAAGMTAGSHGSTFGGNPLAMAVANAVVDTILAPGFLEHVEAMALLFRQKLARLKDEHGDVIEEVRGEGLMLGLKTRPPNQDVVAALIEERMLTVPAGDNVVRLLPPLIVTDAEIDDACDRISAACRRLGERQPAAE